MPNPAPSSPRKTELWSCDIAQAVDISSTDCTFGIPTRGIYVGGAGNLIVVLAGDSTATSITFSSVPAGTLLPLQIKTVVKTSTTATNMVALF